ncbi:hypothetical protein CXG81DRAFT_16518 [Caulochytrium protostelioides]|uniref:Uncharacterized protein n=1 Tax=Caulochytrium protostelioides TaxID=1555241 RepID=A0A4P9XEY8_9FUNG|nr:hypothetical protein CXG81DRAFT_16518 [Caulochytrium protostelioides]|eukprot:RKP04098.1 hypothetical protein CXG81DRAFT_16518 [Caulochytrium protostelioides]
MVMEVRLGAVAPGAGPGWPLVRRYRRTLLRRPWCKYLIALACSALMFMAFWYDAPHHRSVRPSLHDQSGSVRRANGQLTLTDAEHGWPFLTTLSEYDEDEDDRSWSAAADGAAAAAADSRKQRDDGQGVGGPPAGLQDVFAASLAAYRAVEAAAAAAAEAAVAGHAAAGAAAPSPPPLAANRSGLAYEPLYLDAADAAALRASPLRFTHRGLAYADADGAHLMLVGAVDLATLPVTLYRTVLERGRALHLNAVAVFLYWSEHQPAPDRFTLRTAQIHVLRFLQTARDVGMRVVLEVAPTARRGGNALVGTPLWVLRESTDRAVRQARFDAFVDAVLRAVAPYVHDAPSRGGVALLHVRGAFLLPPPPAPQPSTAASSADAHHRTARAANETAAAPATTARVASALPALRMAWGVPVVYAPSPVPPSPPSDAGAAAAAAAPAVPETTDALPRPWYCHRDSIDVPYCQLPLGADHLWGLPQPVRSTEDIALATVRAIAKGALFVGYDHLYHSGQSRCPTLQVRSMATNDHHRALLESTGFHHEPLYSHLRDLHALLRRYEHILLQAQLVDIQDGDGADDGDGDDDGDADGAADATDMMTAWVWQIAGSNGMLMFVENRDAERVRTWHADGEAFAIQPWSLSILVRRGTGPTQWRIPGLAHVDDGDARVLTDVFNTARINAPGDYGASVKSIARQSPDRTPSTTRYHTMPRAIAHRQDVPPPYAPPAPASAASALFPFTRWPWARGAAAAAHDHYARAQPLAGLLAPDPSHATPQPLAAIPGAPQHPARHWWYISDPVRFPPATTAAAAAGRLVLRFGPPCPPAAAAAAPAAAADADAGAGADAPGEACRAAQRAAWPPPPVDPLARDPAHALHPAGDFGGHLFVYLDAQPVGRVNYTHPTLDLAALVTHYGLAIDPQQAHRIALLVPWTENLAPPVLTVGGAVVAMSPTTPAAASWPDGAAPALPPLAPRRAFRRQAVPTSSWRDPGVAVAAMYGVPQPVALDGVRDDAAAADGETAEASLRLTHVGWTHYPYVPLDPSMSAAHRDGTWQTGPLRPVVPSTLATTPAEPSLRHPNAPYTGPLNAMNTWWRLEYHTRELWHDWSHRRHVRDDFLHGYALRIAKMGQGHIWVNGRYVGRYWNVATVFPRWHAEVHVPTGADRVSRRLAAAASLPDAAVEAALADRTPHDPWRIQGAWQSPVGDAADTAAPPPPPPAAAHHAMKGYVLPTPEQLAAAEAKATAAQIRQATDPRLVCVPGGEAQLPPPCRRGPFDPRRCVRKCPAQTSQTWYPIPADFIRKEDDKIVVLLWEHTASGGDPADVELVRVSEEMQF